MWSRYSGAVIAVAAPQTTPDIPALDHGPTEGGRLDGSVTQWLARLRNGEADALDALLPMVYDELRVLARSHLRSERPDHTLSATALVHEAYLKVAQLAGREPLRSEDRGQFFALVSRNMRNVLVDHARSRKRKKRGGGARPVEISQLSDMMSEAEADEILVVHDALARLAEGSERAAKVVELRFFTGLRFNEIADLLGVSQKTVNRDWTAARAWLRKEVARDLDLDLTVDGNG